MEMHFDPAYLERKRIFTEEEKSKLNKCALDFEKLKMDKRTLESFYIDFIYGTAKFEGNTYSIAQTETLIKDGLTAAGKPLSYAIMIKNLQKACSYIERKVPITAESIRSIHALISNELLEDKDVGNIRLKRVRIAGTDYIPLGTQEEIKAQLATIIKVSERIDNVFERSIYLHCNIAHLQPFRDCNKRTAKMVQNLSFINAGVMPLFFQEKHNEEYRKAILEYYNTGKYDSYKGLFTTSYLKQTKALSGFDLEFQQQ